MNVDIFIRLQESPIKIVEDNLIRLYYNGQWIDFKDGKVFIAFEDDPRKRISNSDDEIQPADAADSEGRGIDEKKLLRIAPKIFKECLLGR